MNHDQILDHQRIKHLNGIELITPLYSFCQLVFEMFLMNGSFSCDLV